MEQLRVFVTHDDAAGVLVLDLEEGGYITPERIVLEAAHFPEGESDSLVALLEASLQEWLARHAGVSA